MIVSCSRWLKLQLASATCYELHVTNHTLQVTGVHQFHEKHLDYSQFSVLVDFEVIPRLPVLVTGSW